MTAPSTTPFGPPEPLLLLAALRDLNVTVAYSPLPGEVGAIWHALTQTLILATGATADEHVEFMTNLWKISTERPAEPLAQPRRRHLYAVS